MGDADWRAELDGWLAPFLAVLGHRKRRSWAPAYLSVVECFGTARDLA